ncbi:hypothetical protein F0562_027626 [Nyssa sinensis]|uniref:Uncharacterized protein n=1 Tax=Nyssa sinensis TaxID=561372 RepID=A0A5J5B5I1_9ASTE|nr:hypothetical protein F0562_027626 [Nyssa sinensis]
MSETKVWDESNLCAYFHFIASPVWLMFFVIFVFNCMLYVYIQGTEEINEQGEVETKVETVDYRSPPGHDSETKKVDVEVIHLTPKDETPGSRGGSGMKGTEEINEQGEVETKVETVDYRSPLGHDSETKKVDVEVIHLTRKDETPGSRGGSGGGIMACAAAAAADTVRSAKDAISGRGKNNSKK